MHGSMWRGLETERTYCVTAPAPDPTDQPVRQTLGDGVDDDLAVAADTAAEVEESVDAAALGL
jgi:hypothetical protein